jgi:hypothetical protein
VNPLPKEKASAELHGTYDALSKKFGKTPNIFGLMAHRPDVLGKFLPFYSAVMEGGTIEPRYKELARFNAQGCCCFLPGGAEQNVRLSSTPQ